MLKIGAISIGTAQRALVLTNGDLFADAFCLGRFEAAIAMAATSQGKDRRSKDDRAGNV